MLYLSFLRYPSCPFSVPGPVLHLVVRSPWTVWVMTFLWFALFLVILMVLRIIGQVFYKICLSWDVSEIFRVTRQECVFLEGRPRGHVTPCRMVSRCRLFIWHQSQCPWWASGRLLHCEVPCSPEFHTLSLGRKSWRGSSLIVLASLWLECLHRLLRILCEEMCLCSPIYSHVLCWQHQCEHMDVLCCGLWFGSTLLLLLLTSF